MNRSLISLALVTAMVSLCAWASTADDALKREVKTVSLSGTLEQALTEVAKATRLKVMVDWGSLEQAGAPKDTRVSVRASAVTAEQMLDLILNQAAAKDKPLAWFADGDTLRVSTQARVIGRHSPLPAMAASQPASKDAKDPSLAKINTSDEGIKFDNIPIGDVLEWFRVKTKINIAVNWRSLEETGITKETPITVEAKDITVGRALDLVLAQVNGGRDKFTRAYWVVEDGVLTIASGNALNTDLKTTVQDVSDLLVTVPNFEAPRLNLNGSSGNSSSNGSGSGGGIFQDSNSSNSSGGNNGSGEGQNMKEMRETTRQNLVDAIKESIGEDMWSPTGKGSVKIVNGKLILSQTALGYKLMRNSVRGN